MTLRENQETSLCTAKFPLPKDGVENNAIPIPQEALQCQPQTFILITSVAWTTGSQQSNQLTAGGEGLHPSACQLGEWIKASREDSPGDLGPQPGQDVH